MLNQRDFLKKFNIKQSDWQKSGLKWADMKTIYQDYSLFRNWLQPVELFIANSIKLGPSVHAVKSRVKDSDHLVEKIIRHSAKKRGPWANPNNYRSVVTDLIGVRALHLFKEEWICIHDYICDTLKVRWKPKPIAYVRKGDHSKVIQQYKSKNCKIVKRDSGYTSLHYIIDFRPNGSDKYIAEIQVRTLFEEAWSEISHAVRYPYDTENPHLESFTKISSQFAGQLDVVSSIVKLFKQEGELRKQNPSTSRNEKLSLVLKEIEEKLEWLFGMTDSISTALVRSKGLKLNFK
jgi:ppGpp synthetase/RelA/SpoT-type nucleotidyltranferase